VVDEPTGPCECALSSFGVSSPPDRDIATAAAAPPASRAAAVAAIQRGR